MIRIGNCCRPLPPRPQLDAAQHLMSAREGRPWAVYTFATNRPGLCALAGEKCTKPRVSRRESVHDFALAYDTLALRLRRELGIEDDWSWRYDTFSGGQQKRLQVACALWSSPDVLAVDEPTNHLDLGSVEALERMLVAYPGALLLVSHDAALVRTATSITRETKWRGNSYGLVVR